MSAVDIAAKLAFGVSLLVAGFVLLPLLTRSKAFQLPQHELSRSLLGAFSLACAASLAWSVGNVVSSISMKTDLESRFFVSLQVAWCNYLGGWISMLCYSWLSKKEKSSEVPYNSARPLEFLGVLAKVVNTVCFLVAVSFIGAGSATVFENLSVFVSLVLASLTLRKLPSIYALIGGFLAVCGCWLIAGRGGTSFSHAGYWGPTFGVFAAASLAAYTLVLSRLVQPGETGDITFRRSNRIIGLTFAVLTASIAVVGLVHGSASSDVWLEPQHLLLQACNGVVNIGVTYGLVAFASRLVRNDVGLGSFLLTLGLGYSVPFTLILESVWISEPISAAQSIGMAVYLGAFAVAAVAIARVSTISAGK